MKRLAGLVLALILLALGIGQLRTGSLQENNRGPSGGVSPTPKPKPAGELSIAYPEEPHSLNPYLFEGDSNATRDLLRPVLPTLLGIAPNLRYYPSVASAVPSGRDISKAPFSVRFRLNRSAQWSDGTPITSADVKFTWETISNQKWPVADRSGYQRITDVIEESPRVVRLVFDGTYSAWKDLFSAGDFILPKHVMSGKDFGAEMAASVPFSAGPYLLKEWVKGLKVTYEANPRWWGAGPHAAGVTVLFVPDTEIALRLLRRGTVQAVATTTQPNLSNRLRAIPNVEVQSRYGSAWWELGFNHSRPQISNRSIREGIARGIDRSGIAEAFIRQEGRELQHLAPGRRLEPSFAGYAKDPARAEQLLGVARGKPLVLASPGSETLSTLLASGIEKGLADSGVDTEFRRPNTDDFYARWLQEGKFDLALWEKRGSPSMSLAGRFRSDLAPPAGHNYSRLASPAVDTALASADIYIGTEKTQMNTLMAELSADLPAIPMLETRAYIGSRMGLSGPSPNATIDGPLWNLQDWKQK